MKTEREEKVVRVFISSTFKEFETERKILASDVFPRLRNLYASRGISVIAVDLRWGLEREQIESLGLVDACLEQVIDCDPYFLGLLGKHYGTVVSQEDLANSHLLKVHNLTGVFDKPISITELEIQLGALQVNNEYAIFFSGGANETADERAIALLDQVGQSGHPLSEYETLEAFEKTVFEKLIDLIDSRFPDDGVEADPEQQAQDAIFFQHVKSYIPGSPLVDEVVERLRDDKSVYIQGAKGVGKSAALAYCANCLAKENADVFLYFCNTGYCFSDADLLRRIASYFETTYSCTLEIREEDEFGTIIGKISSWLESAQLDSRVFICIDAIEQISSSRNLWSCIKSLCDQNECVACLVTGTEGLAEEDCLILRGLEKAQVEELVARELIETGRTLRADLFEKMVGCEASNNPIMLKGILNELSVSGKHSALDGFISELCELRDVGSLFRFITNRVAKEIEALGLDSNGVVRAEAFLAKTHFGASEDEIMNVSGMLPLSWIMLKTALEPFTVSFDGRISFNHQLVELAASAEMTEELLSQIAESALSEYKKEPRSTARIIELTNWAMLAGDDASLSKIIFSTDSFPVLQRFDEDGLRKTLGYLSRDERLVMEDAVELAEAFAGKPRRQYELCLALSRSGCVRSCVAAVDAIDRLNQSNANLLTLKARAIYQQGEYSQVSPAFEKARLGMEAEGRSETAAYARLLLQQAIAEKSCGRGRLALKMAQEACKLFEHLGLENNDSLWCRTYRAALEFSYGYGAGPETFREILESQKAISGEGSYAYFRLMCYSWQSFLLAGNLSEADQLTRQSLEGLYMTSGEGPDYAWALTNRATVLACLGHREEARRDSRESARLNAQTAVGQSHVYSITGTMNEILLSFLGEVDDSRIEQASRRAIDSLDRLRVDALEFHDENHPYVLNIEANMALVSLLAVGRRHAEKACAEVHRISKRLMRVLEGDNSDSLFLDACAWAFSGAGDDNDLEDRYDALGVMDYVLECILHGERPVELRLAVNNGAALFIVPCHFGQ